jgi:hypothetical protein
MTAIAFIAGTVVGSVAGLMAACLAAAAHDPDADAIREHAEMLAHLKAGE